MHSTTLYLSTAVAMAAQLNGAMAAFDPSSINNIAVYWGQNSFGASSGSAEQQPLATYCANTDIDVRSSSQTLCACRS